jgi:hypothetical protein
MGKSKILVIVEGAKTDVNLMKRLLNIYGISETHKIISYNTNIYTLYNQLPNDYDEYEDFDLLQLLKEREIDQSKLDLLNERYSDILLIFDLDPQDPQFKPEKIIKMAYYFTESTNMGKLYLNYPMVEAFYHMESIPDDKYNDYTVTLEVLKKKKYKQMIHDICRDGDYAKFASDKEECGIVINQNLAKAKFLTNTKDAIPDSVEILNKQLDLLTNKKIVSVLCTCVFYIAEYNSDFI